MTPSKIHMQEMELKRTGSGKDAVTGLCEVSGRVLGYRQLNHKQLLCQGSDFFHNCLFLTLYILQLYIYMCVLVCVF